MSRSTFVTVSGIVGSGKSTVAGHAAEFLRHAGIPVSSWRFQSLPCFTWLRPRASRLGGHPARAAAGGRRWTGYSQKPLTARVAFGYALRALSFRVFRLRHRRGCHLFNRYFYDSFVHYRLTGRRERLYAAILRRVIPVPDVAIVLVASQGTIARRRPQYAPEYITQAAMAYGRLREHFPQLIEISTDAGTATFGEVEMRLRVQLSLKGARC